LTRCLAEITGLGEVTIFALEMDTGMATLAGTTAFGVIVSTEAAIFGEAVALTDLCVITLF
jgi:hypothetical protein